jgi:predicted MFS family arabinose efflux permease
VLQRPLAGDAWRGTRRDAEDPRMHSASDWFYSVSESVASYTLTGIIGFIAVKQLKLQDKVAAVEWSRVTIAAVAWLLLLFGLGLLAGNLLGSAPAR